MRVQAVVQAGHQHRGKTALEDHLADQIQTHWEY